MPEKLRSSEERTEEAIAEQKRKAEEYFNALKTKKAEPSEPPEQSEKPKTEEEIKIETLNVRKGPASQFLEELRDDANNDLEQDRKKLKGLTGKRKSSKEVRIDILENRMRDAETALNSLNESGQIEPVVDFIQKIINEHSDSLKEGHVRVFAPLDRKIFVYIKNTVEAVASKAGMGVVLPEEEIKVFENYLKQIKEKTDKKSEADVLIKNIETFKVQMVAVKPSSEKGEPGFGSAKMEALTIGKETFNKGDRIVYKMKRGEVAGVVQGFEHKKNGDIKSIIFLKDGEKNFITIKKADFLKRNPKKSGGEAPETIAATAPESETVAADALVIPVPERKPIQADTEIKPEAEKTPMEKWDGLIAKQKEIIEKISRGELSKEDGENQKKAVSWEIIKQGCKITGEDFEKAMQDIRDAAEHQFLKSIKAQFKDPGKPEMTDEAALKKYQEGEEKRFIAEGAPVWCKGIINGENNLSPEQRKSLLEKGEIGIGGRITLEKEDAAVLIKLGLDITKIKRGGLFGLGANFTIGDETKKEHFENINELNNYIAEKKQEFFKEEAEKNAKTGKEEIISTAIEQYVLDQKIKELHDNFPVQKESPPEFSENPNETASLKIESPDERLDKLNQLRYGWEQANRLSQALRENKKINIGGGEILNPENKEERKKIEEEMAVFSEEIIRVANEISRRSLRREFWQNKFKEGEIAAEKPTDFEKEEFRPEFRKWLTIEVKNIYKTSIEELKEQAKVSGKKVALKDTRSPEKVLRELGKNLPNEKEYVSKNLEEEKKDVIDKYMREFLHKTDFSAEVLRYLTDNQNVTTEDALAFALESGYDIEELRNAMVSRKWVVAGKGKVKIGEKSVDQKELQYQFEQAKQKFSERVLTEAITRLKFDYSTGNLKK